MNPIASEKLARAIGDMRVGLPIILSDSGNGDGLAVLSVESANDVRISTGMQMNGATLVLSDRRASILKARVYDGDIARVVIPDSVGVSWVKSVADPLSDLAYPLKGPLKSVRNGDASLCRVAVNIARRARLLPAALVWPVGEARRYSFENDLTNVELGNSRKLDFEHAVQAVSEARLPLEHWPDARIRVYRAADGNEDHCAIIFGESKEEGDVLVRLHSACLTGDVLGSLKCDCGIQLRTAIARFRDAGSGILLYLNQEGRGIGLVNKIRAYGLQDQGYDTVEANHRLGFEDDERNFSVGVEILRQLGYRSVRLLTNNPAKVKFLEKRGITVVERIPLLTHRTCFNDAYLSVKAEKSGHLL